MFLVATLISSSAPPALDNGAIERVQSALSSRQAPDWLDPGIAADVFFTAQDSAQDSAHDSAQDSAHDSAQDSAHDSEQHGGLRLLADRVRAALAGAPIDVVVQGAMGRRKQLLLADMDSTMIGQECIDELAEHVGKKRQVAAITERAMRGEIEFEPALRERVALLKGLAAAAID